MSGKDVTGAARLLEGLRKIREVCTHERILTFTLGGESVSVLTGIYLCVIS